MRAYLNSGETFELVCGVCFVNEATCDRGPDSLCDRCAADYDARRHRPSREFMVRQAVLNAAQAIMPATVAQMGIKPALAALCWPSDDWYPLNMFRTKINEEFEQLAMRYE